MRFNKIPVNGEWRISCDRHVLCFFEVDQDGSMFRQEDTRRHAVGSYPIQESLRPPRFYCTYYPHVGISSSRDANTGQLHFQKKSNL